MTLRNALTTLIGIEPVTVVSVWRLILSLILILSWQLPALAFVH